MIRTERAMTAAGRERNRAEVTVRLRAHGARDVYAGFLAYCVNKGWRVGWAAHAFKEVYGGWPNDYRDVEAATLPGFIVEEWVACRPKHVIKREKPAPLVDQIVAQEKAEQARVVNNQGFVSGTMMTPEDFETRWT